MDRSETLPHNRRKMGYNIVSYMDNGQENGYYCTIIGYIGVCGNKQYDVTAAMQ